MSEAKRCAPEDKEMSLHAMLKNYEWQSDFAKKHRAEGRDEGRTEGRTEGRDKGRAEGRAESVLTVLRARGLSIDAERQERIRTCGDSELLDRWLQRAVTSPSIDEIFAE